MPDAGTQLDLSSDEVDRIIGFLVYGRVSAPVGFIGLEEGLGRRKRSGRGPEPESAGQFDSVMDLKEAHLRPEHSILCFIMVPPL